MSFPSPRDLRLFGALAVAGSAWMLLTGRMQRIWSKAKPGPTGQPSIETVGVKPLTYDQERYLAQLDKTLNRSWKKRRYRVAEDPERLGYWLEPVFDDGV